MMDNETALIIEQNRYTHTALERLESKFDSHVKEDRAVGELVAKHERYLATSIRVVKWAGGVASAAILGWFGLR